MSDLSRPGPETRAAMRTAAMRTTAVKVDADMPTAADILDGTYEARIAERLRLDDDQANVDVDPLSRQVGGDHYRGTKIQPVEVILDWRLDFCLGNVVKYIQRLYTKGDPVENIDKAIHYLQIARADIVSRL